MQQTIRVLSKTLYRSGNSAMNKYIQQPRIPYLAKLAFRYEGGIKNFPNNKI